MAGPIQLIGLPSVYPNARSITFNGATGENKINLQDNLADALIIQEGSNKYISFVTTNSAEKVNFLKDATIADGMGFVIGHTAQVAVGGGVNEFQVMGTGGADASMSVQRFSANTGAPKIQFAKSRGATLGAMGTTVAAGDPIGEIGWFADDGTDMVQIVGKISVLARATVGSNQVPGELQFSTAVDAAGSALTLGLTIDKAQNLKVGSGAVTISDASGNLTSANGADFGPAGVSSITVLNGIVTVIS